MSVWGPQTFSLEHPPPSSCHLQVPPGCSFAVAMTTTGWASLTLSAPVALSFLPRLHTITRLHLCAVGPGCFLIVNCFLETAIILTTQIISLDVQNNGVRHVCTVLINAKKKGQRTRHTRHTVTSPQNCSSSGPKTPPSCLVSLGAPYRPLQGPSQPCTGPLTPCPSQTGPSTDTGGGGVEQGTRRPQ